MFGFEALAVVAVVVAVVAAALTYFIFKARFTGRMADKDVEIADFKAQVSGLQSEVAGLEALRKKEEEVYAKSLSEVKEAGAKAIEATKTQLALENEKLLKAREESLKKEAAETMKNITGGLDKEIQNMKLAFEAQKKSSSQDASAIKTKFEETVKAIQDEARRIGTSASDLTNALKGKNKMQGIFGETVLENILRAEGLTKGQDYDTEFYIRDKKGNIVRNEETD